MSDNAEFWDSRTEKHGHTGWADPIIYAYDQPARLHAVKRVVEDIGVNRGAMLDFGTGSGDFAGVFSDVFRSVVACDISDAAIRRARACYADRRNIRFESTGDVSELNLEDGSLDLIVSVTVLGHVTNADARSDLLRQLRAKLKAGGRFLALEYTPLQEMPATDYQCFLTPDKWAEVFGECGFVLDKYFGFQHPSERPADSYVAYRQKRIIKLLQRYRKRVMGMSWAKEMCRRTAKSLLGRADDCHWPGRPDDVMRILVFRRSDSE